MKIRDEAEAGRIKRACKFERCFSEPTLKL